MLCGARTQPIAIACPPGKDGKGTGTSAIQDYQASLEKLRKDAAEAALIRDLATDQAKREMFDRLHQHLNRLADDVERVMNDSAQT